MNEENKKNKTRSATIEMRKSNFLIAMSTSTNEELWKNLMYIPAFFLGLSVKSFAILAIFMLIDVGTGVMRTYVVRGGKAIKSSRLGAGVLSKVCIITVPALLAWAGEGAGLDLLPVAQGALTVLILAETYSILGNYQSIRLKRDIVEFDAINFLIVKLRDYLESFIKKDHDYK